VIKTADWIIDLGPEGGSRGGRIIAEGTPEKIAATRGSATGEYLDRVLRGEPLVPLSDVSFAEAAGRTNGHERPEPVAIPIATSRKRATAATKAR
jgi:excinuclease ABC subunit A